MAKCNQFTSLPFKRLKVVKCLLSNVSESKEKFCVSIVDPARPAWFVRHYGYYLYLEPEYNPRNPHIFDDDASFLLTPDKFFPEYFVLESANYPNHYIQVTSDGRMKITKYVHTQEFQNSASFALTDHFVKRTSTLTFYSGNLSEISGNVPEPVRCSTTFNSYKIY